MSFIDAIGSQASGILPLQHEGYDRPSGGNPAFDLDYRAHKRAVRVTGRDDDPTGERIGLGSWILDQDSIGDIILSVCWPPSQDPAKARVMAGWGWAWPTIVTSTSKDVPTPSAQAAHCASIPDASLGLLPVRRPSWDPDDRWDVLSRNFPKRKGKAYWPKPTRNSYGLTVGATDEERQVELFYQLDPNLVAVNQSGDPEMGSLVCDLDPTGEIDVDRMARLHSAFRTLKNPLGGPNAIAFQLGPSGCGDAFGGWFFDRADATPGATVVAADLKAGIIGQGSWFEGGPFRVGSTSDKHHKGQDADGHPINSLHLSTSALFRRDDVEDGPLRFEKAYRQGLENAMAVPVHLAWAGQDWAWWSTCAFYSATPTPGGGRIPVPTPGPSRTPGRPDVPTLDKRNQRTSLTGPAIQIAATLDAIATPALVARPEHYSPTAQALGIFEREKSARARKKADESPLTGILSAFGAQGGRATRGGYSVIGAASGDPWIYNEVPFGTATSGSRTSRYRGGTASGGLIFHPAETDLRDVEDYGLRPTNVTLSTVYFLAAPNAYFGAGVPELITGTLRDGYSWGVDDTTGDLLFRSHSNSQDASDAVRFSRSAQNISWRSGTQFWGQLDHANTADRIYSFPDVSSTITMGTGTAGQVAFWTTTNIVGGDAEFTWDQVTNRLDVGGLLRIGTATDAAASGDLSSGLAGAARLFYDQSVPAFHLYTSSGLLGDRISQAALTATVFNEQGADIDFRVEGDTDANLFFLDASTDRVAFGISIPRNKVHIAAPSGLTEALSLTTNDWIETGVGSLLVLRFGAASGNTYSELGALSLGGNAWNNLILQSGGGRVGIGTVGPDRTLDVLDATNPQLRLTQTDGTVYADLRVNSSGYLYIDTSGGRTGIETTSPRGLFHVQWNSGAVGSLSCTTADWSEGATGSLFEIQHGAASGNTYSELRAIQNGGNTWSNLALQSGGGSVGIGNTSFSARLHVTQSAAGNEVLRLDTATANDDPNFKVVQGRVTTTDATATTINVIPISANRTYKLEARVVARRTGGTAGSADDALAYIIKAAYKTVAGVVTLVGSVREEEDSDQVAWDVAFAISGTNVLLRVTGAAGNDITWHSTIFIQDVGT